MPSLTLPQGWNKTEEDHPDDGVMAHTHSRYLHSSGLEVDIWSEVAEKGRDYTVDQSDKYAVEVYGTDGSYIEGESFETEQAAMTAASEAMERFPR
jgi:murein endopeptidase